MNYLVLLLAYSLTEIVFYMQNNCATQYFVWFFTWKFCLFFEKYFSMKSLWDSEWALFSSQHLCQFRLNCKRNVKEIVVINKYHNVSYFETFCIGTHVCLNWFPVLYLYSASDNFHKNRWLICIICSQFKTKNEEHVAMV